MDDVSYSEERIKKAKSILKKKRIYSHQQLVEELEKVGCSSSQSWVSKNMKDLGYVKHPYEKYYVEGEENKLNQIKDILKKVIYYTSPSFSIEHPPEDESTLKNSIQFSRLYIFPKEGLENSIAELINLYLDMEYTNIKSGVTCGKGCVIVYFKSKLKAKKLHKMLSAMVKDVP
ncbi:hypothetical protein CIW83_18165 [Tissierella sp. P1]|uniref:hypothetical protein n=1 Tax=Tissierella sp. P1 TaxID=1280483 RepID=UPI000BA03607|nr:hypothetical protein [Tissierella sp. P1]OZV10849.1 hypothetical protein CIW83_18165 [Tissierella sp. P1]